MAASNRRRHANALPIAGWCLWITVAVCFVGFCVKALMVRYQVHQGGEKIKELERQIVEFDLKNKDLQTRFERLASRTELDKRRKAGFFPLVEIKEENVVHLNRNAAEVASLETPEMEEEGQK
jgi:cell division protein FtsL